MNTKVMLRELGVIAFTNTLRYENVYPKVNISYRLRDLLANDNAITVENIDTENVVLILRFDKNRFFKARKRFLAACDSSGSIFKAYIVINEVIKDYSGHKLVQTRLGNIRHVKDLTENNFDGDTICCKLPLNKATHKRYFDLLGESNSAASRRCGI